MTSRTLSGRVLGLIGFGRISQQTVRLLSAWDVGEIMAHTRSPRPADWPGVRFADLPDLLRRCDVVVVNLPATPQTRGLLDRSRLGLMKPGSYLVNASRGGIVDERALAELLHSGQLSGAAVDTFAVEPPPSDSPLRSAPNAILTGHEAGHTVEMFDSFVSAAVDNVGAPARGAPAAVSGQSRVPAPLAGRSSPRRRTECGGRGSGPPKLTVLPGGIMSIHAAPDADGIAAAIKVIRDGGIAVLPTDTVYGFFGDATDPRRSSASTRSRTGTGASPSSSIPGSRTCVAGPSSRRPPRRSSSGSGRARCAWC